MSAGEQREGKRGGDAEVGRTEGDQRGAEEKRERERLERLSKDALVKEVMALKRLLRIYRKHGL